MGSAKSTIEPPNGTTLPTVNEGVSSGLLAFDAPITSKVSRKPVKPDTKTDPSGAMAVVPNFGVPKTRSGVLNDAAPSNDRVKMFSPQQAALLLHAM